MYKDFDFGAFMGKYSSLLGDAQDARDYFNEKILPNMDYYASIIKKPYDALNEDEKTIRDFYNENVLPVIKQIAQSPGAVSGKFDQIPEMYKDFFNKFKENFPEIIAKYSAAIPSPVK
jgi:hypothetical protein